MTDLVGQTIGNYKIEARLGVGGMGQVYRARHIHLDRLGALKLLHENLALDESFRERFLREARAVAALRHPNIVEVFEYDEYQGRAYMVMELITGGSLRALLQRYSAGRERPLPPMLDIVRQAADGLAYAHGRGMIHRDIKPDNLLLSTGDRGAVTVKVGDFGLARMVEGTGMTATGAVMGTPAYMSPEQCQGFELDARSDIYSLGVVLYEVAAGALPFQARTISEAAYKHVHVAPPPPSQVVPTLPPDLEQVILRCLAKQPQDRYPSMIELGTELRRLLGIIPPGMTVMTAASPVMPTPATPHSPAGQQANASQAGTVAAQPNIVTPPPLPPVPTMVQVPRIQILDDKQHVVRELDLTQSGATIGRQSKNTIVLDSEAVSRSHARIEWDGIQARITDLGSSNGTLLGKRQLVAQQTEVWPPAEPLQVGSFYLRLVLPAASPDPMPTSGPTAIAQGGLSLTPPDPLLQAMLSGGSGTPRQGPDVTTTPAAVESQRIGLTVAQTTLRITPGVPVTFQAILINQGSTVDHFSIEFDDIPPACHVDQVVPIELLPGRREPVNLTVRSPRSPESRAGVYPVTMRLRSRQNPAETRSIQLTWTVQAFGEGDIAITPRRARGWSGADYQIQLTNRGNAALTLKLAGEDDELALRYRFLPDTPAIEPGASTRVTLRIDGPGKLLGTPQTRLFRVRADDQSGAAQLTTQAELVQPPLLPSWFPPLMLALLVALCFGLSQIPQVRAIVGLAPTATLTPEPTATPTQEPGGPVIEFSVVPDQIAPGDSVTISWSVENADQVEIQQFGTVDASGTQTDRPRTDTEYRLAVTGKNGKSYSRVAKVFVIDSTATAIAGLPPTTPPEPTAPPTDTAIPATDTPTHTPTLAPTEPPGDHGVIPPFRPEILGDNFSTVHQIGFHNDFPNLVFGRFEHEYGDQARQNLGRWDQIVPLVDHKMFVYRAEGGAGGMLQVQGDGTILVLRQFAGFSTDWSQIVYAGNGQLIFYSSRTGSLVLMRMGRGDTLQQVGELESPGRGWSHLVASTDGTLLFYNARAGEGVTAQIDGRGNFQLLDRIDGFNQDWTHLVPTPDGHLLFYQSSSGLFVLANLQGGRYDMIRELNNPGAGWTHLTALDDGTILFYQSDSGNGVFLSPQATDYAVAQEHTFSKGWRIVFGVR